MNLWRDGRTGPAGCLAGNLVLAHLRDTLKEEFSDRKGTTFRGRASVWVGRMCTTDSYLFGRDRHWANLGIDQHSEVVNEAQLDGGAAKYLFITALAGEPTIHYWVIPADLIGQIAFPDDRQAPQYIYSLHIREGDEGCFNVEGEDVSRYHHVLQLNPAAASQLDQAFEAEAVARQRRQEKRNARRSSRTLGSGRSEPPGADPPRGNFEIPLRGGRCAVLQVPLPAAEVDLARIKGWIDLMNDVLTESVPTQAAVETRRIQAVEAVKRLQAVSTSAGKSRITSGEIDKEIHRARRERR